MVLDVWTSTSRRYFAYGKHNGVDKETLVFFFTEEP